MKKVLMLLICVLTFAALLACPALAETERYTTNGEGTVDYSNGSYTASYNGCEAGKQYVLLVVKQGVTELNESAVMYIDQAAANSSGVVSFTNIVPRSIPACNVLLGGDFGTGVNSPKLLGTLTAKGVTVSGSITSYGAAGGAVTVKLENTTYEQTLTVTDGSYEFSAVPSGTYTLTVSKLNHVTREYEVVVGENAVTQDAKICLIGDITEDGPPLDISDLLVMRQALAGNITLNAYKRALADIDSNGALNISDLLWLRQHLAGNINIHS